jgi:hypothetical protein
MIRKYKYGESNKDKIYIFPEVTEPHQKNQLIQVVFTTGKDLCLI